MPPRMVDDMTSEEKEEYFHWLDENETAKLAVEVESVIGAIKNGEMEGEYFEL